MGNFSDSSFVRKHPNQPFIQGYDDRHELWAPVASLDPNAFGLFDLSGNVSEWVAGWFAAYPNGPQKRPVGPRGGPLRILRGGGWRSPPAELRCAARIPHMPAYNSTDTGFRCVVDLPR